MSAHRQLSKRASEATKRDIDDAALTVCDFMHRNGTIALSDGPRIMAIIREALHVGLDVPGRYSRGPKWEPK